MLTSRSGDQIQRPARRRGLPVRQLPLIGAAGMIAYVVLSTSAAFSITGPSTHPSRELFPFFTWSLFSRTTDRRTEYHLTVHAIDDETFDPPVDMRRIDVIPQFGDSRSLGYKALQNVGDALDDGDADSGVKRERFAARFFGRHDVDYQISRHRYNPLRRWREGPASDDVTPIGRFSYDHGS